MFCYEFLSICLSIIIDLFTHSAKFDIKLVTFCIFNVQLGCSMCTSESGSLLHILGVLLVRYLPSCILLLPLC